MATREENLKKINAELEKLKDEELEKVVGGSYSETAGDSKFLNIFGLYNEYDVLHLLVCSYTAAEDAVKAAWEKVGVTLEYHGGAKSNKYYIGGNEVERAEAYRHAWLQLSSMAWQVLTAIKKR